MVTYGIPGRALGVFASFDKIWASKKMRLAVLLGARFRKPVWRCMCRSRWSFRPCGKTVYLQPCSLRVGAGSTLQAASAAPPSNLLCPHQVGSQNPALHRPAQASDWEAETATAFQSGAFAAIRSSRGSCVDQPKVLCGVAAAHRQSMSQVGRACLSRLNMCNGSAAEQYTLRVERAKGHTAAAHRATRHTATHTISWCMCQGHGADPGRQRHVAGAGQPRLEAVIRRGRGEVAELDDATRRVSMGMVQNIF
jgi:hypothetical protein